MDVNRFTRFKRALLLTAAVTVILVPTAAQADPSFYETPLFGISPAPGGSLLVADAGRGIVDADDGTLIASLPGVTDVAPNSEGGLWAVTGGPDNKLYRVDSAGAVEEFADIGAYEGKHDPHPFVVESNAFDVEDLGGGEALVADAAGNTLLTVDKHGKVKLVAVLPDELVSTANAKRIARCPTGPPPICGLPEMIPAEAVPTSIAIGPDGAYYVGELKGFPGPLGESRVWRIEPNARNAKCGQSPLCSVVIDGRTSIIDLQFGSDGNLYVAQIDDASFFALEFGDGSAAIGGSVHSCSVTTGVCSEVVSGIPILTSIAFRGDDLWGAIFGLVPGLGDVVPLES